LDLDGIGDSEHILNANNQDNFPLMGMFSSFNTSLGYHANVISNSTIEDFEYFDSDSTIKIHVSNMTATQNYGFCRVCIPHALMDVNNIVPEFSSFLILPLFMIATLLAVIAYKRKHAI